MKKLNKYVALSALALVALTACENNKPEPPVFTGCEPTKTSIAEGEAVSARFVHEMVINYATPVILNPNLQVTLNGKPVVAKVDTNHLSMLHIELPLVADSIKPTDYTLVLPANLLTAYRDSSRTSTEKTIKFQTAPVFPVNKAMEVSNWLGFGWNLGNHFDTSSGVDGKTSNYWDNATPTASLYQKLAAAGVKTVRMATTWGNYQEIVNEKMDSVLYNDSLQLYYYLPEYKIKPEYMAEVAQNVAWAKAAGLNVIINTHHDEYWLDIYQAAKSDSINVLIKNRIAQTWKQIAEQFQNEDENLIMETFNEIHAVSYNEKGEKVEEWGSAKPAQNAVLKEWNELAVNTIRAVGGNNATRWIAVAGYAANAGLTMGLYPDKASLPNGGEKIMVAIHSYDPYDFTLEPKGLKEQWGHSAWDDASGSDEAALEASLNAIRATYIDKDIPCYLGEFGCSQHTTETGEAFRKYYLEYFCRAAFMAGLRPMLWDNFSMGSEGKGGPESHSFFDHNNGEFVAGTPAAELVPVMVKAATSWDSFSYSLESIADRAPKKPESK